MEILYLLLLTITLVQSSSRVLLNGPEIQTSDLRSIDGYVSSGLPLFSTTTHGFVLQTGSRPLIIKIKDPNKVIRDGIEQPNQAYYRDLPSVIPEGFEGISTSTFQLGYPIPPASFPGPGPIAQQFQQQQQQQQQRNNQGQQESQSSIRIENRISPNNGNDLTNPVVVKTSEFESNLPSNYKNPFYSNQQLASTLATQSLPAPGEEVVSAWNTNKIRDGRVRDLLTGAGLI